MAPSPQLPPPVLPGDRVGVAALSGPVDPGALEEGLAALRGLGFEPVPADNLGAREGLFAGCGEERLDAFHRLAQDPSLKAVFFARGGHGVLPLLPELDWDLLAAHPRAYVGYSDLTPFLLQVVERLGLVSFHGPMVAADLSRGLSAVEAESLLGALAGRFPSVLPLAGAVRAEAPEEAPGAVEGRLLGGCLSMLTATLGTPWAPDLAGAVLFWEDVGEPLYRLDRMLTQWRLSNRLAGIRAMVLGHVVSGNGVSRDGVSADGVSGGRVPADGVPGDGPAPVHAAAAEPCRETLEAAGDEASGDAGDFSHRVFAWLRDPGGPAAAVAAHRAWGLEAGHSSPNRTLPLGARVRLETMASPAAAARLLVLDPRRGR